MADHVKPIPRYVAVMRIIISLIVMLSGFAILTAPNIIFHTKLDDGIQKFAASWIGMVVGYWLS